MVAESWYPALQMARPVDSKLLNYLAPYDPHVSRLALAVRQLVLEEAPEAIESFFSGYAVTIAFSFTGKPLKDGFCHVVAYTNHVNLGFNRGRSLAGPKAGSHRRRQADKASCDSQRGRPRSAVSSALYSAAIEQVGGRADVIRTNRTVALRKLKESK